MGEIREYLDNELAGQVQQGYCIHDKGSARGGRLCLLTFIADGPLDRHQRRVDDHINHFENFLYLYFYSFHNSGNHGNIPISEGFLTTLYQCHIVMGGFPIVAVGYEVADALERYQRQHDIEGLPSFKQFLRYVESEISIPISLARLEDSTGLTHMFLCCYVDTRIRVYDHEELMAVIVSAQFTHVKEILGIDGDLKRVFAPQGTIFSYDVNGKTRVKEQCLIAIV